MVADAAAFALAHALVWTAFGAYLLHLHRLAERLGAEHARIERALERKGP